jgi:adenylate kinase
VVNLDVSDDVALRRLGHLAGAGRVDDARQDAAARGLQAVRSETAPVLDLYRRRGILITVDGTQAPDRMSEAIVAALDRDGGP